MESGHTLSFSSGAYPFRNVGAHLPGICATARFSGVCGGPGAGWLFVESPSFVLRAIFPKTGSHAGSTPRTGLFGIALGVPIQKFARHSRTVSCELGVRD